ncbi:4-hydroxy-tetrahydrodipicolinate synthase [Roseomonas sp. NAR14]|uniref:4-hydroxy-tetrahydrodipicolinate synthase n=1 Tax=Roseomonas acroporae TaxID=2937791 RepID=A0A9X2BVT1_9PROT|nr:4-hydroxy-tetrahydrodipicolinate synthase [Roseomonas acroporae]MCK8786987.1 4-hydroxy-tetrahydrodipicolinate synthase [Roseomonas acroporae]
MGKMRIEGSFVALITPFNADGRVDFGAFRTLLDWHAANGTAAVLMMGSTGEVSMLAPEERRELVERTMAFRDGRMRFFYGCTGNSTDATIGYLRHAKAAGADGAILAAPAYICAPEADIEAYFAECLDAVELPVGIYNNPPRVKSDLHWDHLLRLMRHPNCVVLKESTTRVGQVAQVLAARPDCAVMCCDSPNLGLVVPTMSLGGHGTANMTGNIDPAGIARLSTPWHDPAQAAVFRETYLRLLPLLHFTYSAINPVAVKCLMKAVGLPAGDLRRPLRALPPEHLARGVEIVRRLGLDRQYGWSAGALPALAAE